MLIFSLFIICRLFGLCRFKLALRFAFVKIILRRGFLRFGRGKIFLVKIARHKHFVSYLAVKIVAEIVRSRSGFRLFLSFCLFLFFIPLAFRLARVDRKPKILDF